LELGACPPQAASAMDARTSNAKIRKINLRLISFLLLICSGRFIFWLARLAGGIFCVVTPTSF
jgi:hypothetical protein